MRFLLSTGWLLGAGGGWALALAGLSAGARGVNPIVDLVIVGGAASWVGMLWTALRPGKSPAMIQMVLAGASWLMPITVVILHNEFSANLIMLAFASAVSVTLLVVIYPSQSYSPSVASDRRLELHMMQAMKKEPDGDAEPGEEDPKQGPVGLDLAKSGLGLDGLQGIVDPRADRTGPDKIAAGEAAGIEAVRPEVSSQETIDLSRSVLSGPRAKPVAEPTVEIASEVLADSPARLPAEPDAELDAEPDADLDGESNKESDNRSVVSADMPASQNSPQVASWGRFKPRSREDLSTVAGENRQDQVFQLGTEVKSEATEVSSQEQHAGEDPRSSVGSTGGSDQALHGAHSLEPKSLRSSSFSVVQGPPTKSEKGSLSQAKKWVVPTPRRKGSVGVPSDTSRTSSGDAS